MLKKKPFIKVWKNDLRFFFHNSQGSSGKSTEVANSLLNINLQCVFMHSEVYLEKSENTFPNLYDTTQWSESK